jgi:uncharacterized protein YmfQ (DUF2313 family)
MRTALAYREQLQELLPHGPAWPREEDANLTRLVQALADGLARLDARALALLEEADPLTALEMLPDWERAVGLPDPCTGIPDTTRERQLAVARKLAGIGGQSRAFFVELAALLGLEVEIVEFAPFDTTSRVDQDVGGDEWRFAWEVRLLPPSESAANDNRIEASEFTPLSGVDERLRTFGIDSLECVMGRARPAQTIVLFAYPQDPEPALWFDFILGD